VNFLNQLLKGIAFIPPLVTAIETLFRGKSGVEKKGAAMMFMEQALRTLDAVSDREVVDAEKFRQGIGLVIDGVVQCLNASAWAKAADTRSPAAAQ
jgi:hypothetical protein